MKIDTNSFSRSQTYPAEQHIQRQLHPDVEITKFTIARRDLVEDLAQETFLRVFKALPSFDRNGPARLSTWILTIATRRAIDELRRRRPQQTSLDEAKPIPSTTEADTLTRRRMLAAHLQGAIAELSPVHRAAFLLREYHELSYEEIATHLEVDLGTVKSRLSRARAALRSKLAEVYHAS